MLGRTHARGAGRPALTTVRGALTLVAAVAGLAASAPAASAYIYWTDNGPGSSSNGTTIGRAELDGSGVASSLVSSATGPGGIVSDGSHIYWANNTSSIGRANLDGSGANPAFISSAVTSGVVFAVTTDGSYIYWTDGARYIGRARVDGTGAVDHFIDMGSGHAPFGITIYAGYLYVGENFQIMRATDTGSSIAPFSTINGLAASLASANGYIYWTENVLTAPSPDGVIGRQLVSGGGFTETYVTGLQYPTGVATDGNELYWVDHTPGVVGRATIGPTATNVQPSFIPDSRGPWGIALDSAIDSTSTTVTCNPPSLTVGSFSACTALVGDSASASTPSGTVLFAGGSSSYFSGGNSCTLTPRPGVGASCTVAAASSVPGSQTLTASYSGDPVHAASAGTGSYCAGTPVQCGAPPPGSGPGGGSGARRTLPNCKVPKLRAATLATARRLLTAAHCRLGKVFSPRRRKGHARGALVVSSQQPGPGSVRADSAMVRVWLIPHRRHR